MQFSEDKRKHKFKSIHVCKERVLELPQAGMFQPENTLEVFYNIMKLCVVLLKVRCALKSGN